MLVVYSFSESDKGVLPYHIASLVHFGPYKSHDLLIVTSDDQEQNMNLCKVQALLSPLFNSVTTEILPKQFKGWPAACNVFFQAAILKQLSMALPSPWLWLEPDADPTQFGWIDTIQKEYMEAVGEGFAYLGMRALTVFLEKNPKTGVITRRQDGEHLVGVAVYPAYHGNKAQLWKTPPQNTPFDVRGQWETAPNKVSQNMAHRWGTINYRKEGDVILCDDMKENPDGLSYAGEVPNVALIHGCKDGSLARLFVPEKELNETIEFFGGAPTSCDTSNAILLPHVVTESPSTGADNESSPDVSVTHDADSLGANVQGDTHSTSPSVEVNHENGDNPPEEEHSKKTFKINIHKKSDSDVTNDIVFDRHQILTILSEKKMRLDQLTDRLKTEKKPLEEFLLSEGFTLSGVAKWITAPKE